MEEKVLCVDVDEVLADYQRFFLRKVTSETGKAFLTTADAKRELGVLKYETIKEDYRTNGSKRELRLLDDNIPKLLMRLKRLGFHIAVLSSRPANIYVNIYFDTFIWLGENNIYFDSLNFSREKHLFISSHFCDGEICFVLEDDWAYAEKIKGMDLPNVVIYYLGNKVEEVEGIVIVSNAVEALEDILKIEEKEEL